jgi:hypothetical protein
MGHPFWVMSSTPEVSRFEDPGVLSKEVIQEVLRSASKRGVGSWGGFYKFMDQGKT